VQGEERQAVESNVFHPKLQEALQRYVMPATAHFEFDNQAVTDRDYLFRRREFVELGQLLYEAEQRASGKGQGAPLVTREEIRRFLAEADGRFEAWTAAQEPVTESSDDQQALRMRNAESGLQERRRGNGFNCVSTDEHVALAGTLSQTPFGRVPHSELLQLAEVQTAVEGYRRGSCADEPIIEYGWRRYPSGKETVHCRQRATLAELAASRVWVMPRTPWMVHEDLPLLESELR
jgi:hypothetical protein